MAWDDIHHERALRDVHAAYLAAHAALSGEEDRPAEELLPTLLDLFAAVGPLGRQADPSVSWPTLTPYGQ